MIEVLGWTSTALVLLGYILNAKTHFKAAMVVWIVGVMMSVLALWVLQNAGM